MRRLHPPGTKSSWCFHDAERVYPPPCHGGCPTYVTVTLNRKKLCPRCYNLEIYNLGLDGMPSHLGYVCRCDRCEPQNDFLLHDGPRRDAELPALNDGPRRDAELLGVRLPMRQELHDSLDLWLDSGEKRTHPWDEMQIAYTFAEFWAYYNRDICWALYMWSLSRSEPPPRRTMEVD